MNSNMQFICLIIYKTKYSEISEREQLSAYHPAIICKYLYYCVVLMEPYTIALLTSETNFGKNTFFIKPLVTK